MMLDISNPGILNVFVGDVQIIEWDSTYLLRVEITTCFLPEKLKSA